MAALVLFSKEAVAIDEAWLRSVVPPGTSVRAISLPGFMLNDPADSLGISVQVFTDPSRRRMSLDSFYGRRPPKALLDELASRPLVVELDLVRGTSDPRHPIVQSVVRALRATARYDNALYDEDMNDLTGTFALPRSGAPPYTSGGPVDFSKFVFDHFWIGKAKAPWLGGEVGIVVMTNLDPIPLLPRHVVERVITLPLSIRASLESFFFENLPKLPFDPPKRPKRPSDIWRHLSDPSISVGIEPTKRACFVLSFECSWDPEHGISILFDDCARPIRIGSQGDF